MSFFDELRLFVFGSGKCGYCNQYHGGSKEFWDKRLGKKIIFTQMSCYDSWLKENYLCSNCEICNPYSNDVVQHKFMLK